MADVTVLVIPGLDGSCSEHWQSRWEAERADCVRVHQRDWSEPDPDEWTGALYRAVRSVEGEVVFVAHSLGCLLVSYATALFGDWQGRVRGALLVAPADPERPGIRPAIARFPAPAAPLPFRSIVVASRDDAHISPERARCFAERWSASFVDAGTAGHINAASQLGAWPFGQVLLDDLRRDGSPLVAGRAALLRAERLERGDLFGCS